MEVGKHWGRLVIRIGNRNGVIGNESGVIGNNNEVIGNECG